MRISDWSSDVCSSDLRNAGVGKQFQAEPVVGVERLGFDAVLIVVQTAVGQCAIDIKRGQTHIPGPLQQGLRKARWGNRGHVSAGLAMAAQTTRARSRSWIFSPDRKSVG